MGMYLCTSYTTKRNDTRSHTVRPEAYLREALRESWGIVLAAVLREPSHRLLNETIFVQCLAHMSAL